MTPWLDCAPCRSLPDGGAGNRPATLSLIHQPVEDLSNSRRATWDSESSWLPSTTPCAAHSSENRPAAGPARPKSAGTVPSQSLSMSRSNATHHSVRWIRAYARLTLCSL